MDVTHLEQALATLSPAVDHPDQEEAVRTRWRLGPRHPTTLPEELRGLAHQFENELLARGIDKQVSTGCPVQPKMA